MKSRWPPATRSALTDGSGLLVVKARQPAALVAERNGEIQVLLKEEIAEIQGVESVDEPADARDEAGAAGTLPNAAEGTTAARVYITTDRPIYRPGQTVNFKAVRRDYADRQK